MSNTANLMYEALELARVSNAPGSGALIAKIDEAYKSFQEFEKSYNRDRIGSNDFDELEKICRWCVMFDGAESRFDQIGTHAASILWRHGVHAYVEADSGKVNFEKVS